MKVVHPQAGEGGLVEVVSREKYILKQKISVLYGGKGISYMFFLNFFLLITF